jgi:GTPase
MAYELVRELYPRTGTAAVAGFTGPPGVGKSSLLGALVGHLRANGKRIGVVSVDPSSPYSKGALLGDRIRLADHFLDEGVFIRSMSTRGHLGGVAEATLQALLVLDAAGMDVLLLETVGVGQSEVEVAMVADTVVLVLQPGSGDSIQALKAGVMEIPDIIVINKSDHPAARTMRTEIRSVLSLDRDREWRVPIVETEALQGKGVADLWAAVLDHRTFLERDGGLDARRRQNIEHEVIAVAVAQARRRLDEALGDDAELQAILDEVHARRLDPLTATRQIADRVFRGRDAE